MGHSQVFQESDLFQHLTRAQEHMHKGVKKRWCEQEAGVQQRTTEAFVASKSSQGV